MTNNENGLNLVTKEHEIDDENIPADQEPVAQDDVDDDVDEMPHPHRHQAP
jgi:hypothetical protein